MKIKSDIFSDAVVEHGFFGRVGGKSSGLYDSLNCSKFVGDDVNLVEKNLETVRRELNAEKLITLNQVHGNTCVLADKSTDSDIQADAFATNVSGVAIGILTADCAPVLLADENNHIIGAAHAGWRGAMRGVIQSTVREMIKLGAEANRIKAAIGPCIHKDSYEIGDDFKREFKGNGSCFALVNSKLHFDLPKYCKEILLGTGILPKNIDILEIDTYANPENYFSYRFANQHTNGVCGRNISVICLK
ncbi:MAG: peptidoglycan editing factor PgeF [Alphaproteobacteria bacterium]|nr:peptidoglycan editing factor PgeF [Alphaproteobacteria bacterium]